MFYSLKTRYEGLRVVLVKIATVMQAPGLHKRWIDVRRSQKREDEIMLPHTTPLGASCAD